MLVVSPFSAGGWVCSDVFDHTSQLLFLQTLFGTTVPNISSWRQSTVGDLTTTLPVLGAPVTKAPKLPVISDSESAPPISDECNTEQIIEVNPAPTNPPTKPPQPGEPVKVPKKQAIPTQSRSKLKSTPS
jgi:phospholipase C